MTTVLDPRLAVDVAEVGPFDAVACMNCGVCTATCPLGAEILPRRLFRTVLLGSRERLLEETEVVFSCLLCKACEESCPAAVPITENVRTLRRYIGRESFGL